MDLNGRSRIGYNIGVETGDRFQAFNPATGAATPPVFYGASDDEVRRSGDLAGEAFATYRATPPSDRARFLRAIAQNIEELGEPLVVRATSETGLPNERIRSERARTCSQLRLFADLIEEGSWVDARIDTAEPERKPVAKPDVRSMLRPLGPVVVFGASNFPLAFSVAGGDTASALAAGNPVVVKAHAAHPGTAALVADAVLRAARDCGMPNGVFSLIFGAGARVGTALVQHPAIQAGGFTGSRAAGRKLVELANNRPQPIPFYAEMSSTNPVFVLPGALRERREQIASGLHASFTLGAGQFCTKPGMIFVEDCGNADKFIDTVSGLVERSDNFVLLTKAIRSSYESGLEERTRAARKLAHGSCGSDGLQVAATLFTSDADSFLAEPALASELFGPSALFVRYRTREQLLAIANGMEGQLTATVHATKEDLASHADLIAVLEQKAGRILVNGFPTGVEVGHAMVHGGPHPATSDARTTSVGTRAILRFARPVCYQNFPDTTLPPELQNANPLAIWRLVNGQLTREALPSGS
jgi:2,5-dioxopentanoate dehydrogenase